MIMSYGKGHVFKSKRGKKLKHFQKELSIEANTDNPSTGEVGVGVQNHPSLHRKFKASLG